MRKSDAAPPVLLRPLLPVADRLRAGLRDVVLVLVLLVPAAVATAAYVGETGAKIAFSAAERDGLDVVRPALLAMVDAVAGREPDLAAVRDAAGRHPGLALGQALDALPPQLATTPADRLALATALGALITDAGNTSNLILDPDLDSFYVMDAQIVQLPKAVLAAARTAAAEAGTGGAAAADQAVRAGDLAAVAGSLRYDVSTAEANTELPRLAARLGAVTAAADVLAALAEQLTGALAKPGPTEPGRAEPGPVDVGPLAAALRAAADPLVDVLDDLLAARIDGFTEKRLAVLLGTLGCFVLAVWFAAAVLWRNRRDATPALPGGAASAGGVREPRPMLAGRDEVSTPL
jgi:hypothetical protein